MSEYLALLLIFPLTIVGCHLLGRYDEWLSRRHR